MTIHAEKVNGDDPRYFAVDSHGQVIVELATNSGGHATEEQILRMIEVINNSSSYVMNGGTNPHVSANEHNEMLKNRKEPLKEIPKDTPCINWPACDNPGTMRVGDYIYCKICAPGDVHRPCKEQPVLDPDVLGKLVREVWVEYAVERIISSWDKCTCDVKTAVYYLRNQGLTDKQIPVALAIAQASHKNCEAENVKPDHLLPWSSLSETNKEVDRRIGIKLATWGWNERQGQVCTLARRFYRDDEESLAYTAGYTAYAAVYGNSTPSGYTQAVLADDDGRLRSIYVMGYKSAAIEHALGFDVNKWKDNGGCPTSMLHEKINEIITALHKEGWIPSF